MQLISAFLFPIGMIIFILIMYRTGLYKFQGTRFKTRMVYGLALSIFFFLFALMQTAVDFIIIGKGILLGIVLAPPSLFFTKRWIEKKLDGGTMIYSRNYLARSWVWSIPFIIGLQFLLHTEIGEQIVSLKWPMLGVTFLFLTQQVFCLLYIRSMEIKLGHPIMEDRK